MQIGTLIHSHRLYSQHITIAHNSFFNRLHQQFTCSLNWIPLRTSVPTLLPGSTQRLGSWTPNRTAFSELELDLPLNWALILELLLTVLLRDLNPDFGVWPKVPSPQRDYLLICDCGLVSTGMPICNPPPSLQGAVTAEMLFSQFQQPSIQPKYHNIVMLYSGYRRVLNLWFILHSSLIHHMATICVLFLCTSPHLRINCQCLVAASNGGCTPPSGIPKCSWSHLSESRCNNSQQLNTNVYLTQ
jgi:hypothetical protein